MYVVKQIIKSNLREHKLTLSKYGFKVNERFTQPQSKEHQCAVDTVKLTILEFNFMSSKEHEHLESSMVLTCM